MKPSIYFVRKNTVVTDAAEMKIYTLAFRISGNPNGTAIVSHMSLTSAKIASENSLVVN